MTDVIPTSLVPSAQPSDMTPRQVSAEFRKLLADGAKLRIAGEGKHDPAGLVRRYPPRGKVELMDTVFYVSGMRQNPQLRFFVAYVVQTEGRTTSVYPRIFYKDVSLVWRSASHLVLTADEIWIGKGDVMIVDRGDYEDVWSVESTTDLPLELQTALEVLCRAARRPVKRDEMAPRLVLRRAPPGRIEPFSDFTRPRRKAAGNPRNLIHRGKSIARFTRKNDPTSLRITRGYEPDFKNGVVETSTSRSSLYGGTLKRLRIVSTNRKVQYLFFAGPRHVWITPPQALTTQLSSYGLRTIDVVIDENLCVPGYEFHFLVQPGDPTSLHTQIPEGYAGEPSAQDPDRADASAWLERLPVIREFRRVVLRQPRRRR